MDINDSDFEQEVLKSNIPVVVDFWAEWCGPCKQLGPVLNETANELAGKVKIVKINIDHNTETPQKFGVRSIPTMVLFKDGKALATKVGALPKSSLIEWINSTVS
jgi:thioredoxin 1